MVDDFIWYNYCNKEQKTKKWKYLRERNQKLDMVGVNDTLLFLSEKKAEPKEAKLIKLIWDCG